jgi:PAS domain S-box-containing protein
MVMTAGYMGDVPMSDNPTYEKLKQQVKKLEKKVAELGQMDDRMRLLSLAIEQSNEGMAIVDLDGNLQYLNAAFAKMHEYSVKELIGKNLSIFHTPQHMASVEAANKQVKKTGSFKGEIWHVTRNGTEFSTLTHNSLLRNDIGNPMGIIVKLRNITDLKGKDVSAIGGQCH